MSRKALAFVLILLLQAAPGCGDSGQTFTGVKPVERSTSKGPTETQRGMVQETLEGVK